MTKGGDTSPPSREASLSPKRGTVPFLAGRPAAVALGALALELAGAADRGGALAGALLRRLLVMTAELHLAIDALTLQLLLERPQRLVDIVVANDDLHKGPSLSVEKRFCGNLLGRPLRKRR